MSARHLIERGREHIAAGRGADALRCFAKAADDPVHGPEALSLLAAAYLLPGVCRPAQALTSVRRVATAPVVELEHLTRCAAVALSAGDPGLAEELATRAARRGDHDALPILAAAKVRCGDRAGLRRVLDDVTEVREPVAFWRRLVVETARRGWAREALRARGQIRRARLPAPSLLELLVHLLPTSLYAAVLVAGAAAALLLPHRLAGALLLAATTALAVTAVRVDWSEARLASAAAGTLWVTAAVTAEVLHLVL